MHLLRLDFFAKGSFPWRKWEAVMENTIYRSFEIAFRAVGVLLLTGVLVSALVDIQRRAFQSQQTGLTSMLKINEQLVGKTR